MGVDAALARCAAGQTLPQEFYRDEAIFARDLDLLLNRWICAGHVSDLARDGDFLVTEIGAESAIVVRGNDGVVRGFANVCRHRGSRICTAPRGHARLLTCPYHAWSYTLEGRLARAREMPDGFDPALYGLVALPVAQAGGLIFVSFGVQPPSIAAAAAALDAMGAAYGWAGAVVAARKTYSVQANWKLVMENYHECYHCAPAHPEFSALHDLAQPGRRQIGERDAERWDEIADGHEVFRVMHSTLSAGRMSGSRDGAALAPPMRSLGFDGACCFAELGFLSAFLAYPDHGVIYRFIPRGVRLTEMELVWLVRGGAEAGRDYDPDALTWLWDLTSLADKRIIERNQAGVLSRAYRPGPFSLMEPGTRQFVARYLGELRAGAGAAENDAHA